MRWNILYNIRPLDGMHAMYLMLQKEISALLY